MNDTLASDEPLGSSCIPVTALYALDFGHGIFLLSGAGGSLNLRNASCPKILTTCQVFLAQTIHGIKARRIQNERHSCLSSVLVWGGKSFSFCQIYIEIGGEPEHPANAKIRKIWSQDIDDWVLDATFVQDGNKVVVLTAHNSVHEIHLSCEKMMAPILRSEGMQTLLCSGSIATISQTSLLIASGTVFGEIVVWTCSQSTEQHPWEAQTRHFYDAHRGSVFGVSLSEPIMWQERCYRLLASCSDDRTIRIWDVSAAVDGTVSASLDGTQRSTGFGGVVSEHDSLALAWGHLSRIWHVRFLQNEANAGDDDLVLVSRGEDGVCQYWRASKDMLFSPQSAQPLKLQPICHDRHHAGKNLWSSGYSPLEDSHRIFTGGADGQIIGRTFKSPSIELEDHPQSIPFRQILCSSLEAVSSTPDRSRLLGKALKQYLILSNNEVIAATDAGAMLRGSLKDLAIWTMVTEDTHQAVKVLCSNQCGHLVLYGSTDSTLWVYDIASSRFTKVDFDMPAQISWMQLADPVEIDPSQQSTFRLILNFHGNVPSQILLIHHQPESETFTATGYDLPIPSDFLITSCCYDANCNNLVLGSRSGALVVCHDLQPSMEETNIVTCIRHIHESETVTSIIELPQISTTSPLHAYYLTTGRDGTYAVHRVRKTATESLPNVSTVHRARPQLVTNIEGAYLCEDGTGEKSLMLYGFRSTEFVVWDESQQNQLLALDCGGAHRSWHFQSSGIDEGAGSFVWSKAGSVNGYHKSRRSCDIIQPGGHGREVKALAVSSPSSSYEQIIATGAEDTDIRLFRYNNEKLCYDCIRVLRGHTTGLQHLEFSPCGTYLFSSGGCEEMFVWQLYKVPIIGLGAVLTARLPKEVADSDARIMSFDVVVGQSKNESHPNFLILLAYSNGKVKSFSYQSSSVKLELIEELFVSMTCLTQSRRHGRNVVVIGGTDGIVRLVKYPSMAIIASSKTHQNNIAEMATATFDVSHQLIVTGGDDSAIGISVIRSGDHPRIQTTVVPDAHAAATTAVVVMDVFQRSSHFTAIIASAGNDQKVKIWEVRVELKEAASDEGSNSNIGKSICATEVERVMELWTDVADVSSMELVRTKAAISDNPAKPLFYELLVAGVGMQVLKVRIEGTG